MTPARATAQTGSDEESRNHSPTQQLTGTIMGAFMSYVLVPQGDNATRLLLKVIARSRRWAAPVLSAGDLIMARRQLLNLRELAERHHRQANLGPVR